jgi:putative ABC transport system ATP-binding protein
MEPIIVVRDVHKGFGAGRHHIPILHGISLDVIPGETLYLVGPSGSGKTTLLSLIGCILSPDRGKVRVLGHEMSGMSCGALTSFRKQYLSFVFQSFNLFPNLSALDNVRLMLCMRGVASRTATKRADELLNQVGLGHRARLRPPKLSTGECQRVAIARALANEPVVLLADEPTASLDAENGQSVMRLIKRMAHDRSVTLVIVTHDDRIRHFADRILHLEDGRITREEDARLPSLRPVAELFHMRVPPQAASGSHGHDPTANRRRAARDFPVPPEVTRATSQMRVERHDVGASSQILISSCSAPDLITQEVGEGSPAKVNSGRSPDSLDTLSKNPMPAGTAALRS